MPDSTLLNDTETADAVRRRGIDPRAVANTGRSPIAVAVRRRARALRTFVPARFPEKKAQLSKARAWTCAASSDFSSFERDRKDEG